MTTKWDAIVVGARVAGASTAMLLARAGLSVLCIERSRYGSDTVSTHALMRGGVLELSRWGLLDDVVAAGTPAIRRTVFHYEEESVAVSIKPSSGVGALYAPRRTVLDSLLVDAAISSGAQIEFGATAGHLHRDETGSVAGIVVQGGRPGAPWIARAPLVIGADGRRSGVACDVGARTLWQGQHAGSYLYGYWQDLPTDGYEWFYREGLTAGAIPTNSGATCVFIGGTPASLDDAVRRTGAQPAFEELAGRAGLVDRLKGAHQVGPIRHIRNLPAGFLRQSHGPGWALVGDAGGWMDPMSTHGITSALRDAELLTRSLVTGLGRSSRQRVSLGSYQLDRDRLSLPMLRISDTIASYRWDQAEIRVLLRALSSAMTDEVELLAGLVAAA